MRKSFLLARRAGTGTAFIVLFGIATAASAAHAPTHDQFVKAILHAHNLARAEVSTPPLVWSDSLARDAAEWAVHLSQIGRMEHSQQRGNEGENLWMGTAGAFETEVMVKSWVDEKKTYRFGPFSIAAIDGVLPVTGHYTQVVWRDTSEIGCATATQRGMEYLVCRYGPTGNIFGQNPY